MSDELVRLSRTQRLFLDDDNDACLLPEGKPHNLVALPARDEDGRELYPETWRLMVQRFNLYPAAAERIEALEAQVREMEAALDNHHAEVARYAAESNAAINAWAAEREKVARLVEAGTEIRRLGRLVAHDLNGRVEAGKTAAVWRLADMADAALASVQDGAQEGGTDG